MNNNILTNILNSINSFVSDYRNDLYGYLLESDVQAALFSKLRKDINTSVEVAGLAENKTYKLNLIYTEYLDLFDICCLNQEEVKIIDQSTIYKSNKKHDDFIYHLPVLLAIELKFIKGRRPGNFQKFIQDEVKIKNSLFKDRVKNYLCLCFIQHQKNSEFHINNKPSDITFKPVDKIEELDTCYVIAPEQSYTLTKS